MIVILMIDVDCELAEVCQDAIDNEDGLIECPELGQIIKENGCKVLEVKDTE